MIRGGTYRWSLIEGDQGGGGRSVIEGDQGGGGQL